jgi:hypothetical protein
MCHSLLSLLKRKTHEAETDILRIMNFEVHHGYQTSKSSWMCTDPLLRTDSRYKEWIRSSQNDNTASVGYTYNLLRGFTFKSTPLEQPYTLPKKS